MKNVCILLQNHYDDDIRVRRKAEALVGAGYGVDVIALRSDHSPSPHYQLNGVNVYSFSLGKKRGSLFRYIFEYTAFFVLAFWKLGQLMCETSYDMVDVNNLPDFLVFAAARAKRKGAKIVLDMHEITPEFYISKYGIAQDSWPVRVLTSIEQRSLRFANHVLTINDPIQKLLLARGLSPNHSSVIMNSVDETLFASAMAQSTPVSTITSSKPFVMMYHGTLTNLYGLDIAINAFGKAQEQLPESEFWILGRGPEQEDLERLTRKLKLESKVKFCGLIPVDDIPQWLSRCDIGILATRRDIFLDLSFSNKLPEYIIMKKAVICSRLKAIRYYFNEDALAYFEPMNEDDLARQMVRLYANPQLRNTYADRAFQQYQPIRWEIMKKRYLQVTANLMADEAGSLNTQQSQALAKVG
jgi:glycosyltransferase involved in cell wall biosynthesis